MSIYFNLQHFVVGRKNWLFAGTPEGVEARALFYNLIETAKANQLDSYSYLPHLRKNPVGCFTGILRGSAPLESGLRGTGEVCNGRRAV